MEETAVLEKKIENHNHFPIIVDYYEWPDIHLICPSDFQHHKKCC